MKIKVKASTMVKPLTAKPSTTLWMSNLDTIMPENFHAGTLYFYRSTGAANFFDPVVLKAALSRVLDDFYPMAGRLNKDENGCIEINCNDEGVLFVEAEAEGEIDELDDFTPRPELSRCIPKVDYSQGISSFPLVLVQVTRFKCDGVCLGFAIDHQVADGSSAIHFINSWSEIAQGIDITTPPFLDRRILSARNPPRPQFTHLDLLPPPPLKNPQDNSSISESICSIFKLTRDQLNALKAKCQEDEGNGVTYTTYEALAGHAWRCVSKARGLPKDQETMLYLPVNGRSRLRPPLPQGYFGNVIFKATPIASCGELESNPMKFTVGKIHEALARMDDEFLRSAIDYLEVQGSVDHNLRHTKPYKCPNMGIVSWARFPVYDTDFGWGRPIYMGIGSPPSPGQTIVVRSPINDGSWLYAISLPEEQMQIFEKLFYDI